MLRSSIGKNLILQKKGTPLENPIRSGGSPIGVRLPPILEIRKMKNTIICLFLFLHEFILMTGRTISILAPVVPIQLERKVPIPRRITFTLGEPTRLPSTVMLPATQNKPKSSTMNVR